MKSQSVTNFLFALILCFSFQFVGGQDIVLESSNLPVVVIDTKGREIINSPKITAQMGIINNGPAQRNKRTDSFNEFAGTIGIELRGQSSQALFPMKSFDIELRDTLGMELKRSLLGMPAESDWILYAPYTDKTLMRNFLAYTLTAQMGRWASRCRYVEVIVNNVYQGIYVLMEKINRGANRVDISKLLPTDNSGLALTGGYIFSLDKQPNGWFSSYNAPFSSNNSKRQFTHVYPKLDVITLNQKNYIKQIVDEFEMSLAGPQFQDPGKGVRKYADLNSFIDYFIINEASRNVDGYRLSSYFHKGKDNQDGRIKAGPVWDYDLAFRNANYCNGSETTGWAYRFNYVCPGDGAGLIPFWWERLLLDTAFASALRCRWEGLRSNTFAEGNIAHLIDSIASLTTEARSRHFAKWPILGKYVWPNPNPIASTYTEEIELLKRWIRDRLNWIDANLEDKGVCGEWPTGLTQDILVTAFPNPFIGKAYLQVQSKEPQQISVDIVDMLGRKIKNGIYNVFTGGNKIDLDSQHWPRGTYNIIIKDKTNQAFIFRLVKSDY